MRTLCDRCRFVDQSLQVWLADGRLVRILRPAGAAVREETVSDICLTRAQESPEKEGARAETEGALGGESSGHGREGSITGKEGQEIEVDSLPGRDHR